MFCLDNVLPRLYLELGCVPIKFIIKAKRIMYLHNLLKRSKTELVSKVFYAQENKPANHDWVTTVKKDLEEFQISFSLEQIEKLSKYKFKKLVKKSMMQVAFENLLQEKKEI